MVRYTRSLVPGYYKLPVSSPPTARLFAGLQLISLPPTSLVPTSLPIVVLFAVSLAWTSCVNAAVPVSPPTPLPDIATKLAGTSCLDELDSGVALARGGDSLQAKNHFEILDTKCRHLPQIQHNLGVLAANDSRWSEAIEHLEQSLLADDRAAGTVEQLRQIHRFSASQAYARALNQVVQTQPPVLALQGSTVVNSDSLRAIQDRTDLHTVSNIEDELYNWWLSARKKTPNEWLTHYIEGYPAPDRYAMRQHDWEELEHEIALTSTDAVVVLARESVDASGVKLTERTLLLLRLQDNRWKIYQETSL